MGIEKLTLNEFMQKYWPDGVGTLTMHTLKKSGEVELLLKKVVKKPICDICDIELAQPHDEPEKKIIFVFVEESMALCKKCYEKNKHKCKPAEPRPWLN